jgi:cytochrome c oxidase assembly protein subunit 15
MWFQLALTGLLVALIPLTIVWGSKDKNKFRKLIAVTVFLTFDLIIFGAFTRLSDSGLGCPDWPGCYGHSNPIQAIAHINAAETAMPTGPVTFKKAWIEMIHRYLAMSVGVLIMAQMIAAWMRHRKQKQQKKVNSQLSQSGTFDQNKSIDSPLLATGLFFFVCLQGAFGAWTVTLKLQPIIVTTHLLLGQGLLALLTWAMMREQGIMQKINVPTFAKLKVASTIAFIFLIMQIALGGWVSTNYAALACDGFPACNGELIPALDFEHAFSLWRELGKTMNGEYLPYSAIVTIQWVHRTFAWVVLAVVMWAAWMARQSPNTQIKTKRIANGILITIVLQIISGAATVYFAWPLSIAVLHTAGATVLVLLLTMLNYRVRYVEVDALSEIKDVVDQKKV